VREERRRRRTSIFLRSEGRKGEGKKRRKIPDLSRIRRLEREKGGVGLFSPWIERKRRRGTGLRLSGPERRRKEGKNALYSTYLCRPCLRSRKEEREKGSNIDRTSEPTKKGKEGGEERKNCVPFWWSVIRRKYREKGGGGREKERYFRSAGEKKKKEGGSSVRPSIRSRERGREVASPRVPEKKRGKGELILYPDLLLLNPGGKGERGAVAD